MNLYRTLFSIALLASFGTASELSYDREKLKSEFMKVCMSKDRNRPELGSLGAMNFAYFLHCRHSSCRSESHLFEGRRDQCEGIYDYFNPNYKYSTAGTFDLAKRGLSDLSILRFFPNVHSLYIEDNNISSLDFVKYLPKLRSLTAYNNPIKSIEPLQKFDLELLKVSAAENVFMDLSVLSNMRTLKWLWANKGVKNIDSISNLINLEELALSNFNENICSLSSLINLRDLSIDNAHISDYSCLCGLKKLKSLSLNANNITSLQFMVCFENLETLFVWNNPINDISALSQIKTLKYVSIDEKNLLPCSPKNIKEIKAGISCKNSEAENKQIKDSLNKGKKRNNGQFSNTTVGVLASLVFMVFFLIVAYKARQN